MAVGLEPADKLSPVPGVQLASCSAGIYKKVRPDLTLLAFPPGAVASAVFTRNQFCAAPVIIAREHLESGGHRFCLINAGNANAGTGTKGLEAARETCAALAELAGCPVEAVLPFSTGVIGADLPVDRIRAALPGLIQGLRPDAWQDAARAIMTTDTVSKGRSVQIRIGDIPVTVTGIAKGSGMIRPDMATMLAFITTDARITRDALEHILAQAVESSFNRICVDGDMSTNDACVLVATGVADHPRIDTLDSDACIRLRDAVTEVCTWLAQAIVRDGEGATKFISVVVGGGREERECLDVAYAIARSPLIKTAMFASDPNWGRILAAIGYAGLDDLDIGRIRVYLGDVCIVSGGGRDPDYTEEAGQRVMAEAEIVVRVDLGRGVATQTVWTCDFSYDYVRINADYRS